jgi:hypothetical protein
MQLGQWLVVALIFDWLGVAGAESNPGWETAQGR